MEKIIKMRLSRPWYDPKSDILSDLIENLAPQSIPDLLSFIRNIITDNDDDDDAKPSGSGSCACSPSFGEDFDMDTFVSILHSLRHDIDTLLSLAPEEDNEEDDDDDNDNDEKTGSAKKTDKTDKTNSPDDKAEETASFESRLSGITKHNIHIANDVDSPSYDLILTALRFITLDINDKILTHGYGVSPVGKVLEIEEGDNVAVNFPLFRTKEDLHQALTLLIPAFQKVFPFAVRHED